jgi:hypothetical protein
MFRRAVEAVVATRRKGFLAAAFLAGILFIGFAPALIGGRTLLLASWDSPSITAHGAYDPLPRPAGPRAPRTPDPGAAAWQTEAWLGLIADQFWNEFDLPLWNPYNGYGKPLLASAQPQPFFPLATLLSLHLTAWTYNLFIVGRLLLGGLLAFLFACQFLSALPSVVAAVTFMMSGYFIIYLNMPHLSVEVLTPGILLTFEILARRNSWAAASGAAAMILLANTGGMPESLFLILAFGSLYLVCRVLFTAELRAQALALAVKFAVAVILGFALSALLLLPFLEFAQLGYDVHQPSNVGGVKAGIGHDADYHRTIQYLLPLIFGPVLGSICENFRGWSGLRGYWGIVPFYLTIVAVLAAVLRERLADFRSQRFLTAFFGSTLLLMLLKRYGSPLINWIGELPLSEMVVYPKYQEPLIALCVAMLAGVGFAVLIERRGIRLFAASGAVVLAFMLATAGWYLGQVVALQSILAKVFYFSSVALGLGLLFVTVSLTWLVQRASFEQRPWLLRGFAGLLSLELLATFILPAFYLMTSLPPLRADPYAGAPYIGFIQGRNADYSRIFAREDFLYPNWSAVFKLADVRDLDGLFYTRWRQFVRSFLLPPGEDREHGDLADRFTGQEHAFEFNTEIERRYLALSSIRYLISDSSYGEPFRKIYDGEARVYEVPSVIPRAALYRAIEVVPDEQVLDRLKNVAFDPYESAIVSRESLLASEANAAQSLTQAPGSPVIAARILRYRSRHVAIEAETGMPALLVLSDTAYPGWRVYVNGRQAEIVTANYLFRGVFLAPGKSMVEFRYQPRWLEAGAGISLASFAVLAALVIQERRRRTGRLARSRPA